MSHELLQQGIAALKAGRQEQARQLLAQAVEEDADLEQGWLWLSGAVETDDERRTCLEKVLALNPDNQSARLGLEKLGPPEPGVAPAPPPQQRETAEQATQTCPQCDSANPPGVRFCNQCGMALIASPEPARPAPGPVCSRCGAINAVAHRFCDQCGAPLAAHPAPPPRDAGLSSAQAQGTAQSPPQAGGTEGEKAGEMPRQPATPARPKDKPQVERQPSEASEERAGLAAPRRRTLPTLLTWLGFLALVAFGLLNYTPAGEYVGPVAIVLLIVALILGIIGWRLGAVKFIAGLTVAVSALWGVLIAVVVVGVLFFPEYVNEARSYVVPILF